MAKKKKSTFEKITHIVVWIMIIATVGGIGLTALLQLGVL
ncbi:DUF4044 domain-containing protein [Vagococcus silagei]|uniref:DUF4044 domain-containing protein n=1 Tax=Vagococcus silagei TaxID=2508885 RepID=A0A4S3B3M4_9ENTE|nr:DUF4044 domain-containing protein [Vagococcus silagei]THB60857.1 DUF4044 domain-containing protein [Vagococcus silagei]